MLRPRPAGVAEDHRSEAELRDPQPAAAEQSVALLGESLGGRCHDLVVRYVAQVLADVPAVSERVVELAVWSPQNMSVSG